MAAMQIKIEILLSLRDKESGIDGTADLETFAECVAHNSSIFYTHGQRCLFTNGVPFMGLRHPGREGFTNGVRMPTDGRLYLWIEYPIHG